MQPIRLSLLLYGLIITTILTACGGSTPTQPTSSGNTFLDSGTTLSYSNTNATSAKQDSEFLRVNGTNANSNQSPYEAINAHEAYGYGLSGSGQTINIMDSSFDTNHQEIAGKTSSYGTIGTASNSSYHGLAVASIAAGKKDGSGIHGIAYNADLHLTDYTYYGSETYLPDQWAQLTNDAATNHQAIAQNNSWGLNVTLTDVQNSIQTNNWTNAYAVAYELDQGNYDANESSVNNYVQALDNFQATGVIVYALSNSHSFNEADFQAALPELFPQLAEAWITTTDVEVTGTSGNLVYTRQSAQCGSTAEYCLGADGTEIVTAKHHFNSTTALDDSVYGTSFTAPQISGAIALLAEAFPNHTPAQLVDRLLASANNDFFTATGYTTFTNGVQHGYNSEFGHGMLDLGAALQPIVNTGSPRMVTGTNLHNSNQFQLHNSQLSVSSSFGDSLNRALLDKHIYVYDALNGGFALPLTQTLKGPSISIQQQLTQQLKDQDNPHSKQPHSQLATPYNSNSDWQVQHVMGNAILQTNLSEQNTHSLPPRLSMIWQLPSNRRTVARVEAGIHHAPEALLGLEGSGAFNLNNATGTTTFTNLMFRHKLTPYWQLDLHTSAAISQLNTPQDSLVRGFQNVTSNAYSFTAQRTRLFTDDKLSLQISQPHRLNSGTLNIAMAGLADSNGDIHQQTEYLHLSTSGRQIDLQLNYQLTLADNLALGVRYLTSLEPNHVSKASSKQQQTISLQGDVFAAAMGYDANKGQSSILLRWQGDL